MKNKIFFEQIIEETFLLYGLNHENIIKVKDFYESLRLYHDTTNDYPNVIALEIPAVAIPAVAIPALVIPIVTIENRFIDYQYVEAQAELIEENTDEHKSDIKVIRFS
jgi:hypothetical protein